jgi:23S rRNA pseudouridine1911/1915/1917 synthase
MTNQHWKVTTDEAGMALDKFLARPERLGSRSKAARAREQGKVFVNETEAGPAQAALRLSAGDAVRVWEDRPGSARRRAFPFKAGDLQILYEDQFLIVLNKPTGLLVVPLERRGEETSILDRLEHHWRSHGKRKPLVVHRIDRDTSGVVLFAKDGRMQAALKGQFKERTPERVYLAVVYGHPTPPAGTWRDHLVWDRNALIQRETHPKDPHAAEAICSYKVLEAFPVAPTTNSAAPKTSLIEVRLKTGKQNQIRIQARLRGHTLVGELRYTSGPDESRPVPFKRQALHAWRLSFRHPVEDKVMKFEAPLPEDMKTLIAHLRHGGVPVRPT